MFLFHTLPQHPWDTRAPGWVVTLQGLFFETIVHDNTLEISASNDSILEVRQAMQRVKEAVAEVNEVFQFIMQYEGIPQTEIPANIFFSLKSTFSNCKPIIKYFCKNANPSEF